ncbi:hypothetical protein JGU66_05890 [Myxococcaceae bacterium JPH2]|nr:hypothetical protein [Myxococcaceae bacterium JPH2]
MRRSGRGMRSLWLVSALLATVGCSKKDEPAPERTVVPAPTPPVGTIPREGEAEARPPVHVASGSVLPHAPTTPPGSDENAPAADSSAPAWTSSPTEVKRREQPQATLVSVRTGPHEDYDRVVFEFEGSQLPGYQVAYAKEPAVQCGSGDAVKVEGQGPLEVRFIPARAHTSEGKATVSERTLKPALPMVRELVRTCDFEAEVTWLLGTARPTTYRVLELKDPSRIVVDVKH